MPLQQSPLGHDFKMKKIKSLGGIQGEPMIWKVMDSPQRDDGCPLTIAPFQGDFFFLLVDFVVCAQNERYGLGGITDSLIEPKKLD